MAVLPDLDGLALDQVNMFEKAIPIPASNGVLAGALRSGERSLPRRAAPASNTAQIELPAEMLVARRTGDALRAVEWADITTRLNAARDLRLLMRRESRAPVEIVAASFGDAAASYFALLDDGEHADTKCINAQISHSKYSVNHDGLGQPKVLGDTQNDSEANGSGDVASDASDAAQGDAREMQ